MKKILSLITLLLTINIGVIAQSTISYGQVSSYCPQTGQTQGGGGAIAITFYDGYIYHPLYGKLYATQRNNDGSITYTPRQYAGIGSLQLNAVLVSADYQRMEERITSSMGYASLNMINSYTSMGEDGGRAAQRWADANAASKRGSSNYNNERNNICSSCGGTGVSPTPNSGGSLSSWVAYYNTQGIKCPYCGSYSGHYHDRCSSCNVPRY